MQWNFGIQHELPGKVLFEVGYVGNRGLQLRRNTESGMNLNQLDPQYLALGAALNQQVPNPFAGIGFFSSSTFSRSQSAQTLSAIPGCDSVDVGGCLIELSRDAGNDEQALFAWVAVRRILRVEQDHRRR